MRKSLSFFTVAALLTAILGISAQTVKAARGQTNPVGNDISWPQCGKTLPTTHAFGIAGVNGGTAAKTNPCLSEQLKWAYRAVGGTSQPLAQLYVNTANPGEIIGDITTWPTSNTDKTGFTTNNPYGTCRGDNDRACSWQYGWNRSVEAVIDRFEPAAIAAGVDSSASSYVWWLDVETMNTWQSGSTESLIRNKATLEGMTSYYQLKGVTVGLYSTGYQWNQIVGSTVSSSSNLNGLDSWLAGARSLKGAQSNCKNPALTTSGKVTLTQYVSGSLDYDYSCPQ
ncbi:hypothetical protein H0X09_01015 [Candidatus Saccharibacteria bacterium]|nr:hypothetical protein [Candidatus Saccharibacteria bacterium]